MSKTKTVGGKDYRWDYKNKKWVQSHGASGGESLKKTASSVVGHVKSLFNRKKKNTDKLTKNTKTDTSKSNNTKSKSTEKSADSEKAAWLKKTRNSPAAKSGAFTDEQRWQQQLKHRKSKAERKAKTEARKNKKNKPKLKIKGSEKLGDGYTPKTKSTTKSKVSWESMYGNKNKKKKKKKQDLNFTTM